MSFIKKQLIRTICAILIFCGDTFSFEVSINPQNPVGGEGFEITIDGSPIFTYEILYKGKKFEPYDICEGKSGIFLPINIESSGTTKIILNEKLLGIVIRKKELALDITPRKIKTIRLKPSSEKMRDKQPPIADQREKVLSALKTKSNKKLWRDDFIIPVEAKISEEFAVKRQGQKYSYFHKGVDFSTAIGSPVWATNDGVVVLAEENLNIYGNAIIIDHGHGIISCYYHLNNIFKKTGETVKKGEIIAEVGNTGWSTAPHLHFGIYLQGEAVDPLWWTEFISNRPALH